MPAGIQPNLTLMATYTDTSLTSKDFERQEVLWERSSTSSCLCWKTAPSTICWDSPAWQAPTRETGQPTRADDLVNNPHFNVDPADPVTQVLAATPAELKIYPPDPDPGHEFKNALMQLCGVNATYPDPNTKKYPAIDNSGFIASYRASGAPNPAKIMKCFSPEQVPVLTTLAREFAVCDRWFASIPGPTWPNRFFIHAASSGGLDDSPSSFRGCDSHIALWVQL